MQFHNQVTFVLPHVNLMQRALHSMQRPPILSLAHHYMGNYFALFDFDIEELILLGRL